MVKKKKNDNKRVLKSKNELLKIMNDHLVQQQVFAEKLKAQAKKYLNNEDGGDSESKKKKNHYLNAYNQQVDAVARTSSTLIRIYNSQLENDNAEEENKEELID